MTDISSPAKRDYQRARLDYKVARDALVRIESCHPSAVPREHPVAGLSVAEWEERCAVRREAAGVAWAAYIDAKVALASARMRR